MTTKKKAPMPQFVMVNPHSFELKVVPRLSTDAGVCGLCGEDDQRIAIDDDLGDTVEKETVLHELMHAIWHFTHLDKKYTDEDEEAVAWTMAPRLLALLRDNPELVAYLVG
jgi:hypothetical protein